MTNFLNMLVQREREQADNAIAPRLPSRYEPVERKGALAAFDGLESGAVNLEVNLADERHTDTRQQAWRASNSNPPDTQLNGTSSESERTNEQGAVDDRKPQPQESPTLRGHANAEPEHQAATTPPTPGLTPAKRDRTAAAMEQTQVEPARFVGWVERSATHHGSDGLRPPASTHPTLAANPNHTESSQNHREHEQLSNQTTAFVTQSAAEPAEKSGQDKSQSRPLKVSKGTTTSTGAETGDAVSLPESTAEHLQSAQRDPLSLAGTEEVSAIEPPKATKRRSAAKRPIDNRQDINLISGHQEDQRTNKTSDEALKPIAESVIATVPEPIAKEIEHGVKRPAALPATATPTTPSVEDAVPEYSQPASQNRSSAQLAPANVAMEAVSVKPDLTVGRLNSHSAARRGEDNATHNARDNRTLPLSREGISAKVTVSKPGDRVTTSSSGLLPRLAPHHETQAPPPEPMPTINVTIGRIEVRAVTLPATPKRSNAGPKPMSLSEYLSQHSGERNQRGSR
ncbi:hypothetical protein [Nitrosospira briensis]|uniref:hypothetical protein n=1 Tax=Nitrosospira briensis TaxID=35799 RepID=UPI0008E685A7|nr:hypothetical protein [Nitrosospira briensis]SFN70013.1 hypothetical protein SAMN05216332_101252 [Nitrosospira briensis]